MDTNALASILRHRRKRKGRARGTRQCSLAKCNFAAQGLLLYLRLVRNSVNPLGGEPPTGEPDAGEPPSGSEGGGTLVLPTPLTGGKAEVARSTPQSTAVNLQNQGTARGNNRPLRKGKAISRAPGSAHVTEGLKSSSANALGCNECNCDAAMRGGEQQEVNGPVCRIRTRFGRVSSTSLRENGEVPTSTRGSQLR